MATEQQVLDVVAKIDAATTQQAAVLATEANTLQTISDEIDALIAASKAAGVSDATLASLQAQADKIQAVSDSLDKQSEFSKALASKGVTNPVPVPVPNPTA